MAFVGPGLAGMVAKSAHVPPVCSSVQTSVSAVASVTPQLMLACVAPMLDAAFNVGAPEGGPGGLASLNTGSTVPAHATWTPTAESGPSQMSRRMSYAANRTSPSVLSDW